MGSPFGWRHPTNRRLHQGDYYQRNLLVKVVERFGSDQSPTKCAPQGSEPKVMSAFGNDSVGNLTVVGGPVCLGHKP